MLITDIETHRPNAKNVNFGFKGPHNVQIHQNLHFENLTLHYDEEKLPEKEKTARYKNIPLFEMLKLLIVSGNARLDPRLNVMVYTLKHRA